MNFITLNYVDLAIASVLVILTASPTSSKTPLVIPVCGKGW